MTPFRRLLVAVCLAAGTVALPAPPAAPVSVGTSVDGADAVLVDKSDRRLHLLRGGAVVASYPIALGFAPSGHKWQEGDGRTPEGRYVLDWRNPNSRFHLSLHISYPNETDRAQALARGVSPGDEIFVHGTPFWAGAAGRDWTLGCIAVSNAAIAEIWRAVPDGAPIEIKP